MESFATNHEAKTPNDSPKENMKHLADYIRILIDKGNECSAPTQSCIIFAVNRLLNKVRKEAYAPKSVYLGPLRFYSTILNNMEMHKRVCLDSFLRRAEETTGASLDDFCKLIIDSSRRIHECYEETNYRCYDSEKGTFRQDISPTDDNSKYFVDMILVDACFIIEIFLRYFEEDEAFFVHKLWPISGIRRDLFLLHNQLPLFLLRDIYKLAIGENNARLPPFLHLTCHFFGQYYNNNTPIKHIVNGEYGAKLERSVHFTDLLRTLQLPSSSQKHNKSEKSLWIKTKMQDDQYLYSAIILRDAGVKFKVSSSRCLLDIEFNKNNGQLKIPPLRLDQWTEDFFRNLMAWEQCFHPDKTWICDYIFMMKDLIKYTKDVDLLVQKRIIINQLGTPYSVVNLFNDLCNHYSPAEKSCYTDMFVDLNGYNSVRRHGIIANLKLQYFSTLWKGVATVAATILLLLTLIQTICSVIQIA